MHYLKIREIFAAMILLTGCANSSYKVLFQDNGAAELSVTPDRVLLECEDLYDADIKGLYGFMIHILNDDNKVLTLVQGNTLDKESCEYRLDKIGKILREGKKIYLAGRGNLSKQDRELFQGDFNFPNLGRFKDSGRTLGFVAISNEHGLCYDIETAFMGKPCPPEPFPFWNKK